jgi:hypothetical protein
MVNKLGLFSSSFADFFRKRLSSTLTVFRLPKIDKREMFLDFSFHVHYSTLLHLPPLRFHDGGRC